VKPKAMVMPCTRSPNSSTSEAMPASPALASGSAPSSGIFQLR
jgi:hypothetical protein